MSSSRSPARAQVPVRFERYELRANDAATARAFYEGLLEEGAPDVTAIAEVARARGARPLWLGHLGVPDVDGAARALLERGAARLGPPPLPGAVATFRCPGGAVVAVAPRTGARPRADVAWHQLHAGDVARVAAVYAEVFGWRVEAPELLAGHGAFHAFAWRDERDADGPRDGAAEGHEAQRATVGAMADVAGKPGVHAHWTFFFRTRSLDAALGKVRAAGGVALAPVTLADGRRLAACDDPEGAAFGLLELP